MRTGSLSMRVLAVTSLVLLLFGAATLVLLYRSQIQLATRMMDSLLASNSFSLSALVNARPGGKFDFEITPFALSNYQNTKAGEFFRFLDAESGRPLRESLGAPKAVCGLREPGSATVEAFLGERLYRSRSVVFRPEIDEDAKSAAAFQRNSICLVVGIDEGSYLSLVRQTLFSAVPVLICLILTSIGVLLICVRELTQDLSRLSQALQTVDFGATQVFPPLPETRTEEVSAVVDKLRNLHEHAADVYREMWFFLGRAAHQLKTPVAAIQATLQVTLRRNRTKEELLAGMTDLESAVSLLATLIQKLIASSRISYQALSKKEAIDLRGFLEDQVKLFIPRAEQGGVEITIEPCEPANVLGTPTLLGDIFGNLIENAVLYSTSGGRVSVSWATQRQNVVISIRDEGPGFPENVKTSLFEPFIRGDERHVGGTGLGLSIAKKSAQILGGDITLKSSTRSGSTLDVTLPLRTRPEPGTISSFQ